MNTSPNASAMCWICGKIVDLETCKTDEHGNAVHGRCYAARLGLANAAQLAEKPRTLTSEVASPAPPTNGHGSMAGLTYPEWQEPLHAALMETDQTRLKQKALEAEAAVLKRRQQIIDTPCDGDASHLNRATLSAEWMAISDALSTLNTLRRELARKNASQVPSAR